MMIRFERRRHAICSGIDCYAGLTVLHRR